LLCLILLGLITAIVAIPYQFGTEAAGSKTGGSNPRSGGGDTSQVQPVRAIDDDFLDANKRTVRLSGDARKGAAEANFARTPGG